MSDIVRGPREKLDASDEKSSRPISSHDVRPEAEKLTGRQLGPVSVRKHAFGGLQAPQTAQIRAQQAHIPGSQPTFCG